MDHVQLPDFITFSSAQLPRNFVSPRLASLSSNYMQCRLQGLLSPEVAKVCRHVLRTVWNCLRLRLRKRKRRA